MSSTVPAMKRKQDLKVAGDVLVKGNSVWHAGNLQKSEFTSSSHVGTGGSSHAAVTTTTNGFMIASDKLKLNGIQDNAINQITTDARYLQLTGGRLVGDLMIDNTGSSKLFINADTDNDTAEGGEPILVLTQDGGIVGAEVKLSQGGANDNTLVLAPFMDYNTASPIKNYNVFVHDKKVWHEGNFLKSEFTPVNHIGTGGNTHAAVTTSTNGFMISTDKSKLDGISANAKKVESSTNNGNIKIDGTETTVYTHPSTDGNKHLPSGGASGQWVKWSAAGTGAWTGITWADVASKPTSAVTSIDDAVGKRHNQNTDTGTTATIFTIASGTDVTMAGAGLQFGNATLNPYVRWGTTEFQFYKDWNNGTGDVYAEVKALTFKKSDGTEVSYSGHTHSFDSLTGKPSTYAPPIATSTILGGVKQGTNVSIAADGTISGAYLKVTQAADGLMSKEDKTKLDGVSTNAKKVESSVTNGNIKIDGVETNVYTHPTTSGNKHIPSGGATNQYVKYSSDGTGAWATVAMGEVSGTISDTQHGTKTTDTLHAVASTTAHGFMSKTDKARLDAIQDSAINQTSADARYLQLTGGSISGGDLNFNSNTLNNWLYVRRLNGSATEYLRIGHGDGGSVFEMKNDEVVGSISFKVENTDTEGSDGTNASSFLFTMEGSKSGGAKFLINGAAAWHSGNFNPASKLDATHAGTGGASHAAVTTTVNGFMTAADKIRLDGMSDGANKVQSSTTNGNILIDGVQTTVYSHPIGDGYLHVPATGTVNNGKFLKAGSTEGSLSWTQMNFTDVAGTVTDTQHGNRSGGALHAAVTTTVNGFMTAADKVRLNNIQDSAINQTTADGLYLKRNTNETLVGKLEIQSSEDGILRLRQMGNIGGIDVKDPAWNYIEFLDSEGDRQSYFGINPAGDMVFQSEITGVVKIGSNTIWHTGTFNPSSKLDATHAGTGGTSHALVTTLAHGFMSSDDKVKLNGISTSANKTTDSPDNGYILIDDVKTQVYTHPTGDGNLHVPANGITNNGKFLKSSAVAGDYTWQQVAFTDISGVITDTQHGSRGGGSLHATATQAANGFMLSTDKKKLDEIEAGANLYVHPTTHALDMITETTGLKIMTAAERTKLAAIAESANNYTHPATHSLDMITETTTKKIMTDTERTKLAGIQDSAINQATADGLYVNQAGDTMTGMLKFDNRVPSGGTWPSTTNGFEWLLASDGAYMYVQEVSQDRIDYVFKMRDNTTGDRFVFWIDDYQGESYDKYPLIMTGARADVGVPLYVNNNQVWDAGNLSKSEFTPAAHVGTNGSSHAAVTATVNGFMLATDKVRLDGMEDGANKYIHPSTHPATMITEDTTHRFFTDTERTKLTNIEESANNYVHPATHDATMIVEDATHRFFTDTERTKLTGIAENANNYTHPSTHSLTMITETATQKIMTDVERTKLAGIAENANNYSHPATHALDMITETTGLKIMTAAERTKLAAIAESANNYVHPTTDGNKHLPSGGVAGQWIKWSSAGTGAWTGINFTDVSGTVTDTQHGNRGGGSLHAVATQAANGFMSSGDKVRLDNIQDSAINQTTTDGRYLQLAGGNLGGTLTLSSVNGLRSGGGDNNSLVMYSGGGSIFLRPNGDADSTNQVVISLGSMSVNGNAVWHAGNFIPANKSDVGHTHTVANITDLATNYYNKTEINTQMAAKGDVFAGRATTFTDTNTFTKAGVALKIQPSTAVGANAVLLQVNNNAGNSLVTIGTAVDETKGKLVINGDLVVTGTTVQSATQDIQGDMNVTGNLNVTGNAVLGDSAADQATIKGDLRLEGNFMPVGKYLEVARMPIFGIADDFQFETDSLSFEEIISSFSTFDVNGQSAFAPVSPGATRYYRLMVSYASSGTDDSVLRIIEEGTVNEVISFALPAVNAPLNANSGLGNKARTWMSAHFPTSYMGNTTFQGKKNVSGNLAIRYIELIAYDHYA